MENIAFMFGFCKSLIYLNLYNFKIQTELSLQQTFEELPQDLKYCVKDNYEKIIELYNSKYKNFGEEEMKNEINILKKEPTNYIQIISAMIRVAELEFHFRIRSVQIISLLICLLTSNNKGLIEEIKTGEGKTIVIQ